MTHPKIPFVPFHFIRHGETDWNLEGRIMGHQDIPLNSEGKSQAHQAAPSLQGMGIERIVSSPLLRAFETATILSSYLKVPLETCESLKEAGWGEMEGELKHNHEGSFEKWLGGHTSLGGESCIDFQQRVIRGLAALLTSTKSTLIVAHSGVFWVIAQTLGHGNDKTQNAAPYSFLPPAHATHPWSVFALNEET